METVTTNQTAARLRQSITRLNRRLRSSALGGISPTQASMLGSVDVLKNPTLGDLASAEQIQPPSVTVIVRGLEAAGLITRRVDADDRRSVRVRTTALGRKEMAQIRRRKTEFLERRLAVLSEGDQRKAELVASFLETLLEDE